MNRPRHEFQPAVCAPARFTTAEFLRMAELGAFENMKVELDHGELVRMNPPFAAHGSMQARLIALLASALEGTGLAVLGETGVDLGDETIRALDAAILENPSSEHRLLRPTEVRVAIEVAVTSIDYDLGPKRRDYAAAGITTYWIVDIPSCVIHVATEPQGTGYQQMRIVRFGEALGIPGTNVTIILD